MIVKWFGQSRITSVQLQSLGVSSNWLRVGDIETGIEDETERGVAIDFISAPPEELLEKIDLLLPLCKREDGSGFIPAVASNLDLRAANPQKEAYKLSIFMGMTPEQIDTYIDNNMTSLAAAKEIMKKVARLLQLLAKQNKLDE